MPSRVPLLACLLLGFLVGGPASADGPTLKGPVVRNRLYRLGGKLEFAPSLGLQVGSSLTYRDALSVAFAYHIEDWIALEARGSWGLTGHTQLADQVAARIRARNPSKGQLPIADDLSDLWELRGTLLLGASWAPFYGKVSLFSAAPIHLMAYLWAGGGVGALHRKSVVVCRMAEGRCDYAQSNRFAPVVSLAVGLRIFTGPTSALRIEIRDSGFEDRYRVDVDRVAAEAGKSTGQWARSPGITQTFMLGVGYAFVF